MGEDEGKVTLSDYQVGAYGVDTPVYVIFEPLDRMAPGEAFVDGGDVPDLDRILFQFRHEGRLAVEDTLKVRARVRACACVCACALVCLYV